MLKERGNLISENIPITKELLEFALANNYKISLKNGDYNQTGFESKRTPNNKDLLAEIHRLYFSGGNLHPGDFLRVWVSSRRLDERVQKS